ncbi:MAG: HAD family hydrolase [Nisaea sp.]|jgi:HAD superfamily hydrolase (TIGR01509 family)|nr:hypothetical protein [Rhodospirillaceae bacterium]MCH2631408.1 HAD family hydrolase [Nisaea sp.]
MKWDLIIFDCDGVLVDSEAIGNKFIAEALTELGIQTSADEALAEFLGGKLTQIKLAVERRLDRNLPDDWVDKIYEKQFAEFRKSLKPINGIEAVLQELEKNAVLMCVGSNGPVNKMDVSLSVTGLASYFNGRIFSADHVGVPKPAPDLYLYCAKQLNCLPQRCLVVEDSPRGATAGVSAGMTVFGYAGTGNNNDLQKAGCSKVSSEINDLLEFAGLPVSG